MATIKFWIQIENHPWDLAPNPQNIDRMTGMSIRGGPDSFTRKDPEPQHLISPKTGKNRKRKMNYPLADALILRRYTENWEKPDDRKVNPWDLNEPDPTDDTGTMGTIPGPVIECNIGDTVEVHFRNSDNRWPSKISGSGMLGSKYINRRTHSLHPHGFVFHPKYDGAYPMSPADESQPIEESETSAWESVGVRDHKMGDRVPPGGTFTYTWETVSWPTTAGVWLYHDHSICDTENVELGAIGIIVIHKEDDPDEVINQDLPNGKLNSSLVIEDCIRFPFDVPILPHDLNSVVTAAMSGDEDAMVMMDAENTMSETIHAPKSKNKMKKDQMNNLVKVRSGNMAFEIDTKKRIVISTCHSFFTDPPKKALYLLLLHTLKDVGMCINGRKFLGHTPTLIAGTDTIMRFGIVGMGSDFHTFHLHGHRWIIPGPAGTTRGEIQGSIQNQAVSQFEDTRTFGPANSFTFTIHEDSFMGAKGNTGEFHMHCHVMSHMMGGMMGSLLVIKGGELAPPTKALPSADISRTKECMEGDEMSGMDGGTEMGNVVKMIDFKYVPKTVHIKEGESVIWIHSQPGMVHDVISDASDSDGNKLFNSHDMGPGKAFTNKFDKKGTYGYHCSWHRDSHNMRGTVIVE